MIVLNADIFGTSNSVAVGRELGCVLDVVRGAQPGGAP
jgi:hypothetical protein